LPSANILTKKLGIDVYEKLVERSSLIPSKKLYYYIFSKNGFKNSLLNLEKNIDNLNLITLDLMISEFEKETSL